jgi:hypothetical protein
MMGRNGYVIGSAIVNPPPDRNRVERRAAQGISRCAYFLPAFSYFGDAAGDNTLGERQPPSRRFRWEGGGP